MRLVLSTSLTAGLAAVILGVTAASAAVPSLAQRGLAAPVEVTIEGIQVASVCGNWEPNGHNRSTDCDALWTGYASDWVKQGDRGSQDSPPAGAESLSSSQSSDEEDEPDQQLPCLC